MPFSIIVVNYNTKNLLKHCLNSIIKNFNKDDYEIIIVDNSSQDGSVEMLKNNFGDRIKLIVNNKNIGFGPANNLGASRAQGKYLFFLNSDTITKSDILAPLKKFLNNSREVGVIGPKLVLADRTEQPYAHGKFPNLLNVIIGKLKKLTVKSGKPFEVDWVSGAALIIRNDIFNQAGGFDEKFFMYFEDIDLCKRVKDLGYKVMVYSEVELIHLGGRSLSELNQRKRYYYKAQDYFYKKHYGLLIMNLMKFIRWPYRII